MQLSQSVSQALIQWQQLCAEIVVSLRIHTRRVYLADTFGRASDLCANFVCLFVLLLLCFASSRLCFVCKLSIKGSQSRPGLMLISLCCPPVLCTSACPKVMAPLYDADAAAEASASATLSYEHIEKSVSQSGSPSVSLAVSQLSSGRRYCFGAAGETDFKLIYSRPN